jgi:dTDP-4-amino-4,6-dideoxygalactose transaminase
MSDRLAIEGGTPVSPRFIVFGSPVIGEEEIREVTETLRSGWIGTGRRTQAFETAFGDYVGAPWAVAVNSCTAALHLSLIVAGVGPGADVLTTPMSFVATANAVLHAGGRPVFADIDRTTLNLDLARAAERITPRTRALLPVHFGGLPCDLDALGALARAHGLAVIEDAAHAVGARHRGRPIGGHGNLTCFSFYPNKNITTGEGGMITGARPEWAEQLRIWRLHGLDNDAWRRFQTERLVLSEAIVPGFKYNMTDLQAALGLHQLRRLEGFLTTRERHAARYDAAFAELPEVTLQPRPTAAGERHGLHLYLLLLALERLAVDRNQVVRALRAENVGAAIHYQAIHLHPYYRTAFGHRPGEFPNAEWVSERVLSLPLTPAMSDEDVERVIAAVGKVVRHYRRP